MKAPPRNPLLAQIVHTRHTFRRGWQLLRHRGPGQVQFWFIALGLGIAAGAAAVLFRFGIETLQEAAYGADDLHRLHSFAETLDWWWIVAVPIAGGLAVGLLLQFLTPDGRVRAVADVIEGAALHDGRVETKAGLTSTACSLITLSTGGSTGREGPVVHLAALLSSWVSNAIRADGITGRDLLGCAVAAAVSASFNAPIAGALFAMEVVLRHFALHAFAPIVIAAAAGTVLGRLAFGDVTNFILPGGSVLEFYAEIPAFLLLGLLCGLVAVATMRAVFWAEDMGDTVQTRARLPLWARPAATGALLGAIAVAFPHVIGVGYETTTRALTGDLLLREAVIFCIVKVVAVAVTVAGRMGGGVFSPSLMLGALTGLAFGLVATGLFPETSGAPTLYALAGMGAVAAAVLGAPISTTLIVFELTGDWQTGLAVMVAVSTSTALASRLVDRSFFLTQLERRGVHLAAGPQEYLLQIARVAGVMRGPMDDRAPDETRLWEMIGNGIYVDANATLDAAMPIFEKSGLPFIPVVRLTGTDLAPELQGALFHVDALKAYNRALAATAEEEHS
ncbi:chloride channel protein [Rhodosalinus sediminis]|jgi:CIC family chloride channel protein|uniref:Chloride channel protein n=1 Tax=Rhodosalinus sediminis TaxID=1940533 RepID=A0A3D9BN61_9RHOB|nr:chloride channel protein [Rhodosalinus sediminis]REC54791.1 chloride channel protein [Rhodosalinus sediminis]